jgi:hypothetical protein
MIQTYTNIMRRFADARPGLKLLAVEDAALPVTVLRTDVLVQEKTELPATDEFFLRFVETGVDSVDSIAAYLGLPRALVLDAAVRQLSAGHVERKDSDRFTTTHLGQNVISGFAASKPTLKQIAFVFDRLLWRPAPYAQSTLLRRGEASRAGMLLIPAASTAAIAAREVVVGDLNRILPGDRARALRVDRIAGRRHLWAPAKLLVFGDANSRELELAVYIDDELTDLHADALQTTKAVSRLGMRTAALPFIPAPRYGINHVDPDADQEDVYSIEHLDHLLHAALSAQRRLTIASPTARSAIVNDSFIKYLRTRAEAGVGVTIIIEDQSQVEEHAARRLADLTRHSKRVRVGYASLSGSTWLIYDDVQIESSFDWLAGGQPNREYAWNAGRLTRSERAATAAAEQLNREANI